MQNFSQHWAVDIITTPTLVAVGYKCTYGHTKQPRWSNIFMWEVLFWFHDIKKRAKIPKYLRIAKNISKKTFGITKNTEIYWIANIVAKNIL